MKKLLLHTCCGPCSTHVIETLKNDYEVTLFYYNPNIYPKEEYLLRLEAVRKIAKITSVPIVIDDYNPEIWKKTIYGFENEPEGGKRCDLCMGLRLECTAEYAKKHNYDIFATTLSISPHKSTQKINEIGLKKQTKYDIPFLAEDFKKDSGFQKSIHISKQYGLYRQSYCGCIYSLNKSMASPNE